MLLVENYYTSVQVVQAMAVLLILQMLSFCNYLAIYSSNLLVTDTILSAVPNDPCHVSNSNCHYPSDE